MIRTDRGGASGGGEWFDRPDPTGLTGDTEPGLRFSCTMCGSCCTGPSGFVLFTDDEADAMAAKTGLSRAEFLRIYTRDTVLGRSLTEKPSAFGNDCVFLDREAVPGRAVCGLYEARPMQCRTWPFWKSNLRNRQAWGRAARGCPGMNQGPLTEPGTIRLTRDRLDI